MSVQNTDNNQTWCAFRKRTGIAKFSYIDCYQTFYFLITFNIDSVRGGDSCDYAEIEKKAQETDN